MPEPNKLSRIIAALDESGPLTAREVTAAIGLTPNRRTTPPVSGALAQLEKQGLIDRVHGYGALKWERVPGTTYIPHKTPRKRPDYRVVDLPPEFRAVGSSIVVALRVAKLFTGETQPSYRTLMDEFGMSRETAFRWLNGWKFVNGEGLVRMRQLDPHPTKGRKRALKPAPMLAPRL